MAVPIGPLLVIRVEVANWLTVTLKEPLIASAVAVAPTEPGVVPDVLVVAALAFILERSAREAIWPWGPATWSLIDWIAAILLVSAVCRPCVIWSGCRSIDMSCEMI